MPFAGVLGDLPPKGWADDFDQLVFRGNLFVDEVYFLHRKSRAVIFGDFIQNHPLAKGQSLRNALFKLAGVAWPQGGVPFDIRLSFTKRKLARRSLEKLLSWDFDKLILCSRRLRRKGRQGIRQARVPLANKIIWAHSEGRKRLPQQKKNDPIL